MSSLENIISAATNDDYRRTFIKPYFDSTADGSDYIQASSLGEVIMTICDEAGVDPPTPDEANLMKSMEGTKDKEDKMSFEEFVLQSKYYFMVVKHKHES